MAPTFPAASLGVGHCNGGLLVGDNDFEDHHENDVISSGTKENHSRSECVRTEDLCDAESEEMISCFFCSTCHNLHSTPLPTLPTP